MAGLEDAALILAWRGFHYLLQRLPPGIPERYLEDRAVQGLFVHEESLFDANAHFWAFYPCKDGPQSSRSGSHDLALSSCGVAASRQGIAQERQPFLPLSGHCTLAVSQRRSLAAGVPYSV